jgi:chemotaxis protein CheY-P-specific phosphatase CheC
MGQAGDTLARELGVFVTLSIPAISIVAAQQLSSSLKNFSAGDGIFAASQLFSSQPAASDLSGLALVMLSTDSINDLKELSPQHLSTNDLVINSCRNMAQTCLDALSEQWQLGFECKPPQIVAHESLSTVCGVVAKDWATVLMVEINYQLEGRPFNGDLILLFPDNAIAAMADRLDQLLA